MGKGYDYKALRAQIGDPNLQKDLLSDFNPKKKIKVVVEGTSSAVPMPSSVAPKISSVSVPPEPSLHPPNPLSQKCLGAFLSDKEQAR